MSYSGGGVITRGNLPRLLVEGVRKVFGEVYDEYPEQFPKLFEVVTSKKAFEEDVLFGSFGLAPAKPEGSGIAYDTSTQGYTPKYQPITYAKGFIVSEEAYEDDLYGVFSKKAQLLAFSMRQTKEVVAANVYNRAFNSSYTMVGGDGQPLLSNNHVNGPIDSSTFSNTFAVQAALSETSIENMVINIQQATNSRGLRIALQPGSLIIPPKLSFEATRILKSVLQNNTANNAVNALNVMGTIKDIVVNNFLTSDTAWFIRTNAPQGMVMINRKDTTFDQDNDFGTSNYRFKSQFRIYPGWSDPRGLYGSGNI